MVSQWSMWTSQHRAAEGHTAKPSPAVCPVHTLSHREEGDPRGGQICQGKGQLTRGWARSRVRLLTPLSWPARPPSGERAVVAPEGSSSSGSSKQRGSILQAGWYFSPALELLILLGSPWNQCFVDLSLFSADWGGYFQLNLQLCVCVCVFLYICLSKACTPSPLTFKWWRTSLSNQCPQKCFRTGFNPFIKTSALSCVKSGFAPTWGCVRTWLEIPPPRNYAKAIRKSWEQNQVI